MNPYAPTNHIIAVKHNDRETDLLVLGVLMVILAFVVAAFFIIKTGFSNLPKQPLPSSNTTEVEERVDIYV